jgi:hypothetical protein
MNNAVKKLFKKQVNSKIKLNLSHLKPHLKFEALLYS